YGSSNWSNSTTPSRIASRPTITTRSPCSNNAQVEELSSQLMEMRLTVNGLEIERDFYFGKLREIEVLCQDEGEATACIQKILDILYATEDGFAAPEDVED
ncbi:Microtubule-associated protein RP/EB member 2, partial [Halocaridina rubra]